MVATLEDMHIEKMIVNNFRCFGPKGATIEFEQGLTAFIGANGSGKTAAIQALGRMFGTSRVQRDVTRQDFHLTPERPKRPKRPESQSDAKLWIEVYFRFPELENDSQEAKNVPQFFNHYSVEEPGAPPFARLRLEATWTDDGTPEGAIDQDLRWIRSADHFVWEDCPRVNAAERSFFQFVYVSAGRDAAAQVSALLRGRLWKAAQWSPKFREQTTEFAEKIQSHFIKEGVTSFINTRISKRWQELNAADTDTNPKLRLVEGQFEQLIRKVEFAFEPDEAGRERPLAELSDGQRALFCIALTAATLEIENEVFLMPDAGASFRQEKLKRSYLTILAIEEPENNLAPFLLSRIVNQALEIAKLSHAQVMLSSHSPAIMSRIEPGQVRYFRQHSTQRNSVVRRINLPAEPAEANRYVRLAIRAHPELYFARIVVLCEGDSERVILPRLAAAMGYDLDPSFVSIVPLGGRFPQHIWRLLDDLEIPYVTLLDLDLGRKHGGAAVIRNQLKILKSLAKPSPRRKRVVASACDAKVLTNQDLMKKGHEHPCIRLTTNNRIYFSFPLDIDFSMFRAFPAVYKKTSAASRKPATDAANIKRVKRNTLKTKAAPELYEQKFDEAFLWYSRLFLNKSKPATHLNALAQLSDEDLKKHAPPVLKDLIEFAASKVNASKRGQ